MSDCVSCSSKKFFVGIDLGGTSIKVGVLNDAGETLAYSTAPTLVQDGADAAVERMAQTVRDAVAKAGLALEDVAQIGLGSPGTLDIPTGMLIRPSNLPGWNFYPIRDNLAKATGRPVTFAHDGPAAAFAEYWLGAGKGESSLILLTLGTGVGCGIVINDHVVNGAHSHGGEAGHNLIDTSENARWCKCGQRGHLEAYASATGVANRTIEFVEAEFKTSLREPVREAVRNGKANTIPKMVYDAAEAGDELALRIVKETARYLSHGMISLIHTIDPACILLGGAMTFGGNASPVGRMFLEEVKKETKSRIFLHIAERIRIDFAQFGGDAGYLGAAGLARQDWEENSKKA